MLSLGLKNMAPQSACFIRSESVDFRIHIKPLHLSYRVLWLLGVRNLLKRPDSCSYLSREDNVLSRLLLPNWSEPTCNIAVTCIATRFSSFSLLVPPDGPFWETEPCADGIVNLPECRAGRPHVPPTDHQPAAGGRSPRRHTAALQPALHTQREMDRRWHHAIHSVGVSPLRNYVNFYSSVYM